MTARDRSAKENVVVLPLKGLRVTRCFVDSGFGLQFTDESVRYDGTFRIESSFQWQDGALAFSLSTDDKVSLGRALLAVGKIVASAMAFESDGHLDLQFTNGTGILVIPDDPRFEAWQFRDSKGVLVVSVPEGGLGVWGITTTPGP